MRESTPGKAGPPTRYRIHPAAQRFVRPSPEDRERLKRSIQEHGCLIPIKLVDGLVIDGVTRQEICLELGLEVPIWAIDEDQLNELSVETWVLGLNLARRHLSASQRAAIAADHLDDKVSAPGTLSAEKPAPDSPTRSEVLGRVPRQTIGRAATKANVHRDSVQRAKAIKARNPAAFAQVKAGKLSLAAAEQAVILDGEGDAVTREKLQPAFRTRGRMIEAARLASRGTAILKECIGQPGAELLVEVATIGKMSDARQSIRDQAPHIICPACQGYQSDGCAVCTSRSWVTQLEATAQAGGAE